MVARLLRAVAAFVAVLVAYLAYAMLAVPWIEPQHSFQTISAGGSDGRREMHHAQRRRILESLFPAGAWELTNSRVKVLETEYGMLLLLDYRTREGQVGGKGGELEIQPCTLVLELPGDGEKRAPRYLALQAPQGAVLQFDRSIDLRRADIGQPIGGRLQGQVRIFSPATQPDGGDALEIVTQNVQMDAGRVWTPHEVQFRVGRSHGSGRGLTIELLSSGSIRTQGLRPTNVAGVRRLELAHLDKAHLEAPPEGLFTEDAGPSEPRATAWDTPVEISCQGPFTFDFEEFVASFADEVNVVRLHPNGVNDHLTCRLLEIHFSPPQNDFLAGLNTEGRQTALKPDMTAAQTVLRRIVAVGQPVELRAPSLGAYVQADRMEYDFPTRRLRLENRRFLPPVDGAHEPGKPYGAVLQHQGRYLEAPRLQYEFGLAGRLGRFWAAGPGVFRGPLPNMREHLPELPEGALLEIAWQGQILLRPHEGLHLASVTGGVAARVGDVGEFRAGELHMWLREMAPEAATPSGKESPFAIEPDRMMAQHRVKLRSPRLSGAVDKLEVWFEDAPPLAADPTGPDRFATSPRAGRDPSNRQAFDLRANLVQLRLLRRGEKTVVEDATLSGNVLLQETQTDKPGETPLVVSGDLVELRGASSARMQLAVLGDPQRDLRALAGARGVTFSGWRLQLDQAANRLWIDGPGKLTLPLRQAPQSTIPAFTSPGAQAESESLAVEWRKGLNFDGQRVLIEDRVETRSGGRVIRSDSLQAILAQPVDFAQVEQAARAEISRLLFSGRREDAGGVTLESQTVENGVLTALDRGQVRNLDLDVISGRMYAAGPGWIESVRQGGFAMASSLAGAPTATVTQRPQELTFVRVDFQQAITGQSFAKDFSQWKITFHESVETVLGPVSRWEERLSADSPGGLGPRGMLLTSRELSIAQMGVSPEGEPHMELLATGRPHIESLSFTADGERLSYDGAKGLLVLEGGREDARFWHRADTGFETDGAAQRIQYWPKENRLDADLRFLDLTGIRNALTPAAPQR